jgi:hypothetical protein
MTTHRTALLLLSLTLTLAPSAGAQQGYFHVENRGGAWWFIDPQGAPVLSIGVDTIRYEGDRIHGTGAAPYLEAMKKKYSDRDAWESAALERLRGWGFNSIGAWSDPELWRRDMPYTVILDIADKAGANWQVGRPVDVYDPRFETVAQEVASKECAPHAHDHLLLGYFSDNELRWGPDWRGKETMLDMYMALPAGAPGRQHAVHFLRHRYADDIGRLNRAWQASAEDFDRISLPSQTEAHQADSDEFLGMVAERYFRVCADAILSADPAHLYLGARFAGKVPDPVIRGARVADVVSVNIYSFDPRPLVEHVARLTGKPVLITEFAFRAEDSGLPNTRGAGPKVPNQEARAKAYADYVTRLESLPEAVGYHWFEWSDEPKEGRFDGENSNYGFVNIGDDVYEGFAQAAKAANAAALEAHKNAKP